MTKVHKCSVCKKNYYGSWVVHARNNQKAKHQAYINAKAKGSAKKKETSSIDRSRSQISLEGKPVNASWYDDLLKRLKKLEKRR